MIKVYCPNLSNTEIGGGWTFLRNLNKASKLATSNFELVSDLRKSDVLFAFSPTTIDASTISEAKKLGKRFILRIDGVPEDSRNSGKGTKRLVEYARQADYIVYQTDFVNQTVGRILRSMDVRAESNVIMNGVDTDVFNPTGPKLPLIGVEGTIKILHVNYRKDNNKRYEAVLAMYRELWTYRHDVTLVLMGRYPTEWQDYNMGFFAGESFVRIGVTTDETYKAMVMRSCDLFYYPSFADPSPNVVMEAMASGLEVYCEPYGGSNDITQFLAQSIHEFDPKDITQLDKRMLVSGGGTMRDIAVKEYNLAKLAERYSHLFLKVAG